MIFAFIPFSVCLFLYYVSNIKEIHLLEYILTGNIDGSLNLPTRDILVPNCLKATFRRKPFKLRVHQKWKCLHLLVLMSRLSSICYFPICLLQHFHIRIDLCLYWGEAPVVCYGWVPKIVATSEVTFTKVDEPQQIKSDQWVIY